MPGNTDSSPRLTSALDALDLSIELGATSGAVDEGLSAMLAALAGYASSVKLRTTLPLQPAVKRTVSTGSITI